MQKTNFLQLEDKSIIPYQISEGKKFVQLEPGLYSLGIHNLGNMMYTYKFSEIPVKDTLINFKDSIVEKISKKVDVFFSKKTVETFDSLKMCHKMGMMLYGSHGTGKTSTARLAMESIITKHNAICIDATQENLGSIISAVKLIREYQNSPLVIFVDEFDARINAGEEEMWLSFLDGNNSFSNSIFIGCTNKINLIPERIKDRKSRIKHLIQIDTLPLAVYQEFISERLKLDVKDGKVTKFAYLATEYKLNLDQVKNALIDYCLEGLNISQAIKEASKISVDSPHVEADDEDDQFYLFSKDLD